MIDFAIGEVRTGPDSGRAARALRLAATFAFVLEALPRSDLIECTDLDVGELVAHLGGPPVFGLGSGNSSMQAGWGAYIPINGPTVTLCEGHQTDDVQEGMPNIRVIALVSCRCVK